MKTFTLATIVFIFSLGHTRAQTSLQAGDIVFTSFSTTAFSGTPDTFSIVLLTPISSGTVIYFSDRGYLGGSSWQFAGATEGTVSWTAGSALPTGTEITIHGLGNAATVNGISNGTVATVLGGNVSAGLFFSNAGDQIIAFQGGSGDPTSGGVTRLAGIHFSSCAGTTDASWDPTGCAAGAFMSLMPPGLTGGSTAMWTGALYTHGKYVCSGIPFANVAAVRTAVMNKANWTFSNSSTPAFDIPPACTFCFTPSISTHPANRTLCAGSSTNMSIAPSGTGITYQWQVNTGSGFTNLSNGGNYSNVTTGVLSINNATVGMNGYIYRCVVTGTCGTATSNSATLTVNDPGKWTGATSTAWSNAANWGCGTVPVATTNITINSGTTFSPVIDIAGAICNDLTIASGATLSFSGTTNGIEIKGSISNNGTFNTTSGKLTFSGNVQSIPAGTYRELSMNGAGNKTLSGAVNIDAALTLTSGIIILGNNDLTIGNSGNISGGNASSFVVINGTGALRQQNIGATGRSGNITFPVGITSASFTPMSITNNGTADAFSVRVIENVFSTYSAADAPTGDLLTLMVVNRTWTVTEANAGGSNATLNFQWNTNNELSGFDRNMCYGSHFKNGTWNRGAKGAAAGSNPYSISMSGVTSFSPFAVGTPGSTLPLTLTSFHAMAKANTVELTWNTSNEINTAGFEVERSKDGVSFSRIGYIAAKDGNYRFTDNSLMPGAYLYRLKMTDRDGKFEMSGTVSVRIESTGSGYELYPNPVAGSSVYIRPLNYQADAVSIKIADLSGRIWHNETVEAAKINSGQFSIPVQQLPSGNYLLVITGTKDGKQQTLQFTR